MTNESPRHPCRNCGIYMPIAKHWCSHCGNITTAGQKAFQRDKHFWVSNFKSVKVQRDTARAGGK